jgi:hypothetical protein
MSATTDNSGIGQWAPVLDGPEGFLPDLPSRLYEEGRFANIPFIAGTQLDEGICSSTLSILTCLTQSKEHLSFLPPASISQMPR